MSAHWSSTASNPEARADPYRLGRVEGRMGNPQRKGNFRNKEQDKDQIQVSGEGQEQGQDQPASQRNKDGQSSRWTTKRA